MLITKPTNAREASILVLERFAGYFSIKPTGCWEWTGSLTQGYGNFYFRRALRAHRFIYELFHGDIPFSLHLDHLCRNPKCVKPTHLEAVTAQINALRGTGFGARNSRVQYCSNNHLLQGTNLYVRSDGKGRECRVCHRAWRMAHYFRHKQPASSNKEPQP